MSLKQNLWATAAMIREMRRDLPEDCNYWSMEDYVLDKGMEFVSQPMTDDQRKAVMKIAGRRHMSFPERQCFMNAQLFVIEANNPLRFNYVEGYVGRIIPVLHAWIEVDEGVVFDPTLRFMKGATIGDGPFADRAMGEWPEGDREYYGVRFASLEEIRGHILKTNMHCSLIDDWKGGYPLLKEKRNGPAPDLAASRHDLFGPGS